MSTGKIKFDAGRLARILVILERTSPMDLQIAVNICRLHREELRPWKFFRFANVRSATSASRRRGKRVSRFPFLIRRFNIHRTERRETLVHALYLAISVESVRRIREQLHRTRRRNKLVHIKVSHNIISLYHSLYTVTLYTVNQLCKVSQIRFSSTCSSKKSKSIASYEKET